MDGIIFLFLAFLTSVASIKLSNFGDKLSKQSKIGSMVIGGILIAFITSLPELVTSISASIINNPTLSFGDILGSNMFNIFALAVFNVYFFKKTLLKDSSKKYIFECIILLVDYLFIFLGCIKIFVSISSFVLLLFYFIYLTSIINKNDEDEKKFFYKDKFLLLKFIFTGLLMVILSILLTLHADEISRIYPSFSSSTIGAILLGITTSLPEVVTTFELLKLNNYNMAISNILGSNIFNFLVLAISDFIFKNGYIYSYIDSYSYYYLFGGLISTILLIVGIYFKNKRNLFYNIISILIIFSYLVVWHLQF